MRTNGYFQYEILLTDGSDFDEYGNPIARTSVSYSQSVECLIKTISDNRKGVYQDGNFRQSSFEITAEYSDSLFSELQSAKRIMLQRNQNVGYAPFEELGSFDILKVEPLLTVGRLLLVV